MIPLTNLTNEDGLGGSAETCRICLEEHSPSDLIGAEMIAPCRCSGSRKYVHRDCLDSWRATKTGGRSFTHCEVCNFEYEIEVLDDERVDCSRKVKFHAHVARDTAAVFLVIQLIIIALAAIIAGLDTTRAMRDLFPPWVNEHEKTSYYIWGFLFLLAGLGLAGLISLCTHGRPARNECSYCYCGGCDDCRCHGSGGGGDDAAGLLVVLVVIVVVLAFIGFFVGIFLASLLMQKIVQRHYRILWLKSETKKFRVVNLDGRPIPEHRAVAIDVPMAYPTPSAPELPEPHKVTYPDGLY